MQVLQINKFYYRRRGAETYFLDLIRLLEQHGHKVGVFSMHHPDNLSSPYSKYFVSNIEYSDLTALSICYKLKAIGRILWSVESQHKLKQLLHEFHPDIAHIHNIYHHISPSILKTLCQQHIPIVHTLHDYKLISADYRLLAKSSKNLWSTNLLGSLEMSLHRWLKAYTGTVDCFISPSLFLKNFILERNIPVQRIEVIPNCIAAEGITPCYTHNGYLLYAGGLTAEKGVQFLLDSLEKIHYAVPLHIAGSGPLAASLQRRYHHANVTWLGQLSTVALEQQYQGALAVVVPSLWYENCPYSVLEAFAYGKPVIATALGGLPELVQPRKTGWLIEPKQPDQLARLVQELLRDPSAAAVLGKQARQYVLTKHDPEKHYAALYTIYQELTL